MRRILLALVLVTGCGAGAGEGNEQLPVKQSKVDLSVLTGLYESGAALQPNQLCMIGDSPDRASFGVVVWGADLASCSGSGTAERQGSSLRLRMTGDQPCTIEARIEGGRVILPDAAPASCSYYCGNAAQLARAAFDKKGSTREDALKATGLVGEPLCGGLPSSPQP